MTPPELERYRRRLQSLAQGLQGEVMTLELKHDPADQDIHLYEEQLARTLHASDEKMLEECSAALARIQAGTFGTCEDCGDAIPKSHLQALPYVRCCVACTRRREAATRA